MTLSFIHRVVKDGRFGTGQLGSEQIAPGQAALTDVYYDAISKDQQKMRYIK